MNENVVNSVGEMLRSAREARKVTLDIVNQETKIAVDVLSALEQDDFETFESDIYLKGFLKTYAAYLGVNHLEIMRALDRQRGKHVSAGGTMWDIEETVTEEKIKSPMIFKRFVLPALILLIIVLAVLFVRERSKVKDLTTPGTQGYLQDTSSDTRGA